MPLNPTYPGISQPWNRTKADQQVRSDRPLGPKAHAKHRAALAAARQQARPRVRVEPVNEEQRHILRHPNAPAFRNTGSVEWPLDRFTHRRIREGSIKIVEEIVGGERKPVKPEGVTAAGAKPAAGQRSQARTEHRATEHRTEHRNNTEEKK